MRLESRWIGPAPADAPTIVMMGEGSASARPWGEFPESLARATGCGVCVCPGAGSDLSDPAAPRRPLSDEALEVLPRMLDAINFSRGILIGHGDAAAIVTIYAGGNKDHLDHRVRGLVLIAPRFFVDGGWDIRASIGYIRVPILIVRGSMDSQCTMAQIEAAQDEAYCPVDVALVDGAGRAPHLEQPDETLAIIHGFVSTLFTTFGEGRGTDRIRSEQPNHGRRA